MRRRLLLLVTVLALVAGQAALTAGQGVAGTPRYQHLNPGGLPAYAERVPVNVVFVGYERGQVSPDRFLPGLPASYEPVVRSRLRYGITDKLGITYRFDYSLHYANAAYEDRFFRQLSSLARPAPLSDYQAAYNGQRRNVLTVRNNHHIDAPSVERWLANNPPPGVDTHENTIFFVNWYGRPDFKFHVYTKTNEPDPDTGYNFGVQRESRKIIAWGGTPADDEENRLSDTHRVWFHDLSAGPESWTDNWNVDNPDLDGNGQVDYRMPPIWEYRAGGFRAPGALAGDLSKITRYVGVDLLFTPSPLYPPELPVANPPETINVDANTYEGRPGVDASTRYVDRWLLLDELRELRPMSTVQYDNQDLPYVGDAKRCYLLLLDDRSCYPATGLPPDANLYLFNKRNLERTKDDGPSVDYEMPVFNYSVPAGVGVPALGFADDNYRNGTQSYVFNFVSPEVVEAGYGLTTTTIHEVGHHLGLSHPHDGYDSASGTPFVPADAYYFAWAGDESNSMMSYIDLNWDFSQFDKDNSNRWLAAAHTENANQLAARILADPDAAQANYQLRNADIAIGNAKAAFAAHDYLRALVFAEEADYLARKGARRVGLDISATSEAAEPAAVSAEAAAASHAPPVAETFVDTLGPDSHRSRP